MEDKLYWYWLCGKVRLPIKKQKELMDIFIHPKELYKINPEILKEHMTQLEYDRFIQEMKQRSRKVMKLCIVKISVLSFKKKLLTQID